MAIEINPKVKKEKKSSPYNVVFFLVFMLFLASLAGYFVLGSYKKAITKEISENKEKLKKTSEEIALETKIFGTEGSIGYQEKINDFGILLGSHKLPLNFLNFLEENTHPKVWFSSFNFDLEKNLLQISGYTDTFEILGQQALIFKNQNFIRNIDLSNVSLEKEGKVKFNFQLTIDPKIFK